MNFLNTSLVMSTLFEYFFVLNITRFNFLHNLYDFIFVLLSIKWTSAKCSTGDLVILEAFSRASNICIVVIPYTNHISVVKKSIAIRIAMAKDQTPKDGKLIKLKDTPSAVKPRCLTSIGLFLCKGNTK